MSDELQRELSGDVREHGLVRLVWTDATCRHRCPTTVNAIWRKAAAYHQKSAGHLPAALAPKVEKA
jgi:hypothetical protein